MTRAKFHDILVFIKKLGRPVFTTHEVVTVSGKSASTVVQSLNRLRDKGLLIKIYRGLWVEQSALSSVSVYDVIPFLFSRQRVYVSFISALHLHGIVEQIPQVITLASTAHTHTIKTQIGVFSVHQIAPSFFDGFDWHKGNGSCLVAEPEKALVDSLYLSSRKKKSFGHFPELDFSNQFSFKKAHAWTDRIQEKTIRLYVQKKLKKMV